MGEALEHVSKGNKAGDKSGESEGVESRGGTGVMQRVSFFLPGINMTGF